MMQLNSSQEISLPTGCLKALKSARGLILLTARAATTICGARSGRALTAVATYAQISCAFDRAKSELSARKNWSGVAVPILLATATLTARAKASLPFAQPADRCRFWIVCSIKDALGKRRKSLTSGEVST